MSDEDLSPLKVRSISQEFSTQFSKMGMQKLMSDQIVSIQKAFQSVNLGNALQQQSGEPPKKPTKK